MEISLVWPKADLVTGDFYVTGLVRFTLVCGETVTSRLEKWCWVITLVWRKKNKILSRQMHLVLSPEGRWYSFTGSTTGSCGAKAAASKLPPVCSPYPDARIEPSQTSYPGYEIKDFLQMDYATKAGSDLRMPVQARSWGSLFWLFRWKPKQLWGCDSDVLIHRPWLIWASRPAPQVVQSLSWPLLWA